MASLGLWAGAVWGGEAELKKFQETKVKYDERLAAARATYENAERLLAEMERRAAAARNYAQAHAVRLQRQDLARRQGVVLPAAGALAVAAPLVMPDVEGVILLAAETASLKDGVARDAVRDALHNWQSGAAAAEWRLGGVVSAGEYEVEVTYATPAGVSGGVAVSDAAFLSKLKLEATNGEEDFQAKKLGKLRLTPQSQIFRLNGSEFATGKDWLLKSIRLLPPQSPY